MTTWDAIAMKAGEPPIEAAATARKDMETHHGTHRGLPAVPKLYMGAMLVSRPTVPRLTAPVGDTQMVLPGSLAAVPTLQDAPFWLRHDGMQPEGTALGPCHMPSCMPSGTAQPSPYSWAVPSRPTEPAAMTSRLKWPLAAYPGWLLRSGHSGRLKRLPSIERRPTGKGTVLAMPHPTPTAR